MSKLFLAIAFVNLAIAFVTFAIAFVNSAYFSQYALLLHIPLHLL
ncbi:MAG: hypothetical protein V7K53_06675 [Nostoc sp.]